MANTESDAVRSLQKHIEDMRNLTLCKICLKPFYEPYILGCGHTYCYSCLRSWFVGGTDRKRNRNCPDCRTVVRVLPAPNYLLRDLTHLFVGRMELLPEDETVEEHARDKEEEANILMNDRKGNGLFQGIFKSLPHPFLPGIPVPPPPIRDEEDDVMRCPVCTYEVADGVCTGCGLSYHDSDVDLDLSDLDDDISTDSDNLTVEEGVRPLPRFSRFHGPELDEDGSEDNEDGWDGSEPNHYDENDDFIDNENEDDADDMDGGGDYDTYPTDAATPYSDGNSQAGTNYDTEDEIRADPQRFQAAVRSNIILDSDDEIPTNIWESDREEETSSSPSHRPRHRFRTRRRVLTSDEEEEDEEEEVAGDENVDDDDEPLGRPSRRARTFQAPELSSSEDDGNNDHSHSEEDSNDNSRSSSDSPSTTEDNDSNSDEEHASEDSDDTAIPPQSGRERRQRLRNHRSRRSQPGTTRIAIDVTSPPPRARNYGRVSRNEAIRSGRRGRLAVH